VGRTICLTLESQTQKPNEDGGGKEKRKKKKTKRIEKYGRKRKKRKKSERSLRSLKTSFSWPGGTDQKKLHRRSSTALAKSGEFFAKRGV